jgi:hypothetical protein
MTGQRPLMHVGVTGRQWLLPWMGILLVVAAMTYAMIGAFNGSWATPYWWPAVAIASPASEGRAADTMAYENAVRDVRDSCTSLFGSYNYWLFEENRTGPCGLGVATKGDGDDMHARLYVSLPDSMLNTGVSEAGAHHPQP